MLMGEAFRNGTFIAIEASQKPSLSLLVTLVFLGIPGNFVLLISCPPKSNVPGSYLLYALCVADLIFFLDLAIPAFITSINGGYATGKIGCTIQYFILTAGLAFTVLIIQLIALERHLAVCYKRPLKMYEILGMLVFVTVIGVFYGSLVPLTFESDIAIDYQKHTFICTHAWFVKSQFANVVTYLAIPILPVSIAYICAAYLLVYKTFRQAFNAARHESSSSSSRSSTSRSNKEMDVFKTCTIITAVYFATWIPYWIRIVVETTTEQPVNESFATASELFVILNSFLDPYILMIFDNRVRGIMMKTAIGKAVLRLFEKKPKPNAKQNPKRMQKVNQVNIKNTAVATQHDKTIIIN